MTAEATAQARQSRSMSPAHRRGCVLGALVASMVFGWVLFAGQPQLGEPRPTTDFYDLQTRAWFDGRWDVSADALSIEAFVIDGDAYMYFGPVPAVLRVPVLALTDAYDGRLSQVSMLGAFALLLMSTARLTWRVRTLAGLTEMSERATAAAGGIGVFAVGAGTTVVVLAAQPIVYHEAILWGVALALASFDQQGAYFADGRRSSLVAAGALATLAVLTRASVGIGPVASLLAVLVVVAGAAAASKAERRLPGRLLSMLAAPERWFVPAAHHRRITAADTAVPDVAAPSNETPEPTSPDTPAPDTPAADTAAPGTAVDDTATPRAAGASTWVGLVCLAAAAFVPILAYVAVNQIKFDHPYQLPLDRQVFSEFDPARQAALEANDGSLFGVAFVPTTAWQYLRPDALDLEPLVPFVTLPRTPATVVGDVTFDTLEDASSLTSTMPGFVVLAVLGAVALVRPGLSGGGLAALRLPVLGATAGFVGVLSIAYVANRYLGDALPLLVLTAAVGFYRLLSWERWRTTGLVVVAVLCSWGVVANLALAVESQRLVRPADPELRYVFVQRQYGGSSTHRVSTAERLGEPAVRGSVVILGDCQALVWSDGASWVVLEGEVPDELVTDRARSSALTPQVVLVDSAVRPLLLCRSLVDSLGD